MTILANGPLRRFLTTTAIGLKNAAILINTKPKANSNWPVARLPPIPEKVTKSRNLKKSSNS